MMHEICFCIMRDNLALCISVLQNGLLMAHRITDRLIVTQGCL